jgi:hypothetical protein
MSENKLRVKLLFKKEQVQNEWGLISRTNMYLETRKLFYIVFVLCNA